MTLLQYNLQDQAANHTVLNSGPSGAAANGTASVNTNTLSQPGPGDILARAFANPTSVTVPQFTFWQPGFYSAVAVWILNWGAGETAWLFGKTSTATGFGVALDDDGNLYLNGEDDGSDTIASVGNLGVIGENEANHFILVFDPIGDCKIYQNKVLIGDFNALAGSNLTINALFNGGVDSGNDGAHAWISGLTIDPVTATGWDQARVNAEFNRADTGDILSNLQMYYPFNDSVGSGISKNYGSLGTIGDGMWDSTPTYSSSGVTSSESNFFAWRGPDISFANNRTFVWRVRFEETNNTILGTDNGDNNITGQQSSGTVIFQNANDVVSTINVMDGQFHDLAFSDGSSYDVYCDGKRIGSIGSDGEEFSDGNYTFLNSSASGVTVRFIGCYNRTLTPFQIMAIHASNGILSIGGGLPDVQGMSLGLGLSL